MKIEKEKLLDYLEADLIEWNDTLETMDEESREYDFQIGEIQYIEYLIRMIKEGKII